jgi:glyoxylase-like metal-dependent hydrolase (beta-lactamase superfamily II)
MLAARTRDIPRYLGGTMRHVIALATTSILALAVTACGPQPGTLQAAADTLAPATLRSIEFSGSGRWFQFGQAPSPTLPWPEFTVSAYTATVDFETPGARVQMTRLQAVEPGRARPAPVEQRPVQMASGTFAWNMAPAPGAAPGTAVTAQPQPAAVEERMMEIWSTPQGFVRAALANTATAVTSEGGSEVSFNVGGKYRYEGTINAQNHVERVRTWIDNPVLGDTLVETTFSDYRDFGGITFPGRVQRTQGGHPVLDLTVSAVTANPTLDLAVPDNVRAFTPPPVRVDVETLARGVFYLVGGSHHSVAIDQADHVIVIEAPQQEERSLAVIAKVKETIPGKPIRYLINSHVHFDHSGGLRTYVDEGATIVTHELNRPYYEKAWAAPHALNPDRLHASKKAATFQTFTDKLELTDGKRRVEVHAIVGNGHNDAFAMVYLPAEKILVEVDAYSPPAPNAPMPTTPNPFAVNLHDNIQRLKLDVSQIAPLHGRVATMGDLRRFIGMGATTATR